MTAPAQKWFLPGLSLVASLAAGLGWETAPAGGSEAPGVRAGVRTLYLIRHGAYDHDDPRDPDVVYVSELRDPASADLAVKLALTGHLVLTALHAPTATAALLRLIDAAEVPLRAIHSDRNDTEEAYLQLLQEDQAHGFQRFDFGSEPADDADNGAHSA